MIRTVRGAKKPYQVVSKKGKNLGKYKSPEAAKSVYSRSSILSTLNKACVNFAHEALKNFTFVRRDVKGG
jgi:hypothetical protein